MDTPTKRHRRQHPSGGHSPARNLVAGLCLCLPLAFGGQAAAQDSADHAWFTDEQADRGERVYLTTCGGCHGLLMSDTFAEYSSAETYFLYIQGSMPWESEGSLPTQSYVDIVAYLMRERGFPAGDVELRADREVLARIVPADSAPAE